MILYLLRHGKAEQGNPDFDRELTPRGRDQIATIVARRGQELSSVSRVYSSPLVRARQTAQIVVDELLPDLSILFTDALIPEAIPEQLASELTHWNGEALFATHQPYIGDMVYFLTGETIEIPTGTLIAIETDIIGEGWGHLLWAEYPER